MGAPRAILGALGGRHFVLCVFFSVTAFYLAVHGKLTADYAAAITAISGFTAWRAVSEDRNDERCGNRAGTDDEDLGHK
ncbi:MAG: hypothetical protein ACRD4S_17025 [Candidatus Acidiferrales bacterium]